MRIYIHGNCQAGAMAQMLQQAAPHLHVTGRQVHQFNAADPEQRRAMFEDVERADVIFSQPVSAGYMGVDYLSDSWIENNRRANSIFFRFPNLYYKEYNPQTFTLHGLTGVEESYHDVHMADAYLRELSSEQCLSELADPEFFSATFLQSELYLGIAELARRQRDYNIEISATDAVLSYFCEKQLFCSFNHPVRIVLMTVLNKALELAGLSERVPEDGECILGGYRIYPYPSVIAQLGLKDVPKDLEGGLLYSYRHYSQREYVEYIFAYYESQIGRSRLSDALHGNAEAVSYLKRHKAAR